MLKRIAILFLAVLLGCIVFIVGGVAGYWNGTADTSWYEQSKFTYTINSEEQLAGLANLVNEGTTTFEGKTIRLTKDLDLSSPTSQFQPWIPIGKSQERSFRGTFNGENHEIKNLKISQSTSDYEGLFGYLIQGKIQNLKLTDCSVFANEKVGGIVGFIDRPKETINIATIENCAVRGTVAGKSSIGGIIGEGYVNIISSSFIGTVSASSSAGYVGGLIGFSRVLSELENSYALVTINGHSVLRLGGLIGYAESSIINKCYAAGVISNENGGIIGGLVGVSAGSKIINSAALNKQLTGTGGTIGRIVGIQEGGISSTENVYGWSGMINNGGAHFASGGNNGENIDSIDLWSALPFWKDVLAWNTDITSSGISIWHINSTGIRNQGWGIPYLSSFGYTTDDYTKISYLRPTNGGYIDYLANGAAGTPPFDEKTYLQSDQPPAKAPNYLTYPGYHFTYWIDEIQGNIYHVSDPITLSSVSPQNILKANWEMNEVTVTFDAETTTETQTLGYGDSLNAPLISRPGQYLHGWYLTNLNGIPINPKIKILDKDGLFINKAYGELGTHIWKNTSIKHNSQLTLTAEFGYYPEHATTIHFQSTPAIEPADIIVIYHESHLREKVNAPEKEGYIFCGWTLTEGGEDYLIDYDGNLQNRVGYVENGIWIDDTDERLTVYAKWEKIGPTPTITPTPFPTPTPGGGGGKNTEVIYQEVIVYKDTENNNVNDNTQGNSSIIPNYNNTTTVVSTTPCSSVPFLSFIAGLGIISSLILTQRRR